jgi:cysteine desulfurase family protein
MSFGGAALIYFDNAATSWPKPPQVAQAAAAAIDSFGNPSRSAHAYALAAGRVVEYARDEIAALFHCRADNVAFTKNVTEALNIAIQSVEGHIVSTAAEHNSVLRPLHTKSHSLAALDSRGRVTLAAIAGAVRQDTAAVVVAHASNLTGNLAPVKEIGAFCRARGLLFILDTAQTAGLLPADMEELAVDALCFTGHKSLYGLQGTGGICLGSRFRPKALLSGGSGSHSFEMTQPPSMPDLLEAGTLNGHGIAGLLAGLRYIKARGPATLLAQAQSLAQRFYQGTRALALAAPRQKITFYGDYEAPARAPIVALNLGSRDSGAVAAILSERYGVAVRAGVHCAPLLHRHFGTETQGAVRFSFSHFNTAAEVDFALAALGEIIRQ